MTEDEREELKKIDCYGGYKLSNAQKGALFTLIVYSVMGLMYLYIKG